MSLSPGGASVLSSATSCTLGGGGGSTADGRADDAWNAAGFRAALSSAMDQMEEWRNAAGVARAETSAALAQLSATTTLHARERSRLEKELGALRERERVGSERVTALEEQLRHAQGEICMVLQVVAQVRGEAETTSVTAAAAIAAAEERAAYAVSRAAEAASEVERRRVALEGQEAAAQLRTFELEKRERAVTHLEETLKARESSVAGREVGATALVEDCACRERALGEAWRVLVDASGGGARALPSQGSLLAGPSGSAVGAVTLALEALQRRELAFAKKARRLEEAAVLVAAGDKAVAEKEASLQSSSVATSATPISAPLPSAPPSAETLNIVTAQASQLASTLLALRECGVVTQAQIQLAASGELVKTMRRK